VDTESKSPRTINGLIVRSEEPLNLEMPFARLDGFTTPNESFYVRCHFPVPQIAAADWRLQIEGEVDAPFALNYDEIRKLPARTIAATLECAGNNRLFLDPKVKGVQWELGAVGNAEWTGVSLSALLECARINASAVEVILDGADEGTVEATPRPPGRISFARSIPVAKALDDVLLAYEMNGEPLTAEHGFPLRAIVPGWYAAASVKWLRRIIVTAKPFAGYYQSTDYTFWDRSTGLPSLAPLTEQQVKAEIARPAPGEVVARDSVVPIRGAAWTSDAEIAKVEVSADGGTTWNLARLSQPSARNAWRLWEYDWRTSKGSGKCILMARATDSRGRTQPTERDPDRGTYMINHVLPIEVEVR
jgi:DMSO/TMAO reductase YedYZ molybdopterin-dependent catalytic subunit